MCLPDSGGGYSSSVYQQPGSSLLLPLPACPGSPDITPAGSLSDQSEVQRARSLRPQGLHSCWSLCLECSLSHNAPSLLLGNSCSSCIFVIISRKPSAAYTPPDSLFAPHPAHTLSRHPTFSFIACISDFSTPSRRFASRKARHICGTDEFPEGK